MSISELTDYFLRYGAFFYLFDRAFRIFESPRISGRSYYAAGGNMGGER